MRTLEASAASGGPAAAPTVALALRAAEARLAAAGIPTARPDAELLLARVLGTARLAVQLDGRPVLSAVDAGAFETLVDRRARHEPLQYLLGEAEFAGLRLGLAAGVFVPRPETEELVARALDLHLPGSATVVDLCTGSGAIACALAARRPGWTVTAVDAAPRALECARANVLRLGLAARVRVLAGDLFAPLSGQLGPGTVDLVVANPPYLDARELATVPGEVRDWEPREALDGGPDGLAVIRRLVAGAPGWLRPGGVLLLEIGEGHGPAAARLLADVPAYAAARLLRDFRGCVRFLEARRV